MDIPRVLQFFSVIYSEPLVDFWSNQSRKSWFVASSIRYSSQSIGTISSHPIDWFPYTFPSGAVVEIERIAQSHQWNQERSLVDIVFA
jgi:hypothetical protein